MDYGDNFEYSDVVSAQFSDVGGWILIASNPVQDRQLNIYLLEHEAESVQLQLLDYAGRLVREKELFEQKAVLNVYDLLPGIYLLRVQMEGQRFLTEYRIGKSIHKYPTLFLLNPSPPS